MAVERKNFFERFRSRKKNNLVSKDIMTAEEVTGLENLDFLAEQKKTVNPNELGKRLGRTLYSDMEGVTRHVFFVKENPREVVKADKLTVNESELQEEKIINNILNKAFPFNVARINETFYFADEDVSGTIMQRIYPDQSTPVKHPITEMEKICKEDFELPRFIDTNNGNKVVDEKTGGEYYLDDILLDGSDIIKAKSKIEAFIMHKGLSKKDKEEMRKDFIKLESIKRELISTP